MARSTTPKAKRAPKKSSGAFSITFDYGGEQYKAQGNTILDALKKIKAPTWWKSKAVITVTHGKQSSELLAYPMILKRLFINNTYQLIFEKRMLTMLK